MNNTLDDVAVIDNLTVNNLAEVPFAQMLTILAPYVLVDIPEDASNVDMKKRLDFLLARTANLHAYLTFLGVHASHQRAILKGKQPEAAEDMLKKKEALYELASATKLKYEACSRKITLAMSEDSENDLRESANHANRAAAPRPDWSQSAGTAGVRTNTPQGVQPPSPTSVPRKQGGWGNIAP